MTDESDIEPQKEPIDEPDMSEEGSDRFRDFPPSADFGPGRSFLDLLRSLTGQPFAAESELNLGNYDDLEPRFPRGWTLSAGPSGTLKFAGYEAFFLSQVDSSEKGIGTSFTLGGGKTSYGGFLTLTLVDSDYKFSAGFYLFSNIMVSLNIKDVKNGKVDVGYLHMGPSRKVGIKSLGLEWSPQSVEVSKEIELKDIMRSIEKIAAPLLEPPPHVDSYWYQLSP